MARLPAYREEDFVLPDPGWQPPFEYAREDVRFALDAAGTRRPELVATPSGVVASERERPAPGGLLPIQRGQRVVCRDRELSRVDHVLVDPATQRVTHFVVRAGAHLPQDTLVPIDWVAAVEEDRIVVYAGAAQLGALPAYVPPRIDEAIAADVRERLRAARRPPRGGRRSRSRSRTASSPSPAPSRTRRPVARPCARPGPRRGYGRCARPWSVRGGERDDRPVAAPAAARLRRRGRRLNTRRCRQ